MDILPGGMKKQSITKEIIKKEEKNINDDENDIELLKTLDSIDLNLVKEVGDLYMNLDNKKVDFNRIENNVKNLSKFCKNQKYDYLNNLMYPENCKNVKIPTPIPIPSCSFQLHNCVTVQPNTKGNLAILFNPFFLYSNSLLSKDLQVPAYGGSEAGTGRLEWLSSFFLNNSVSLDGNGFDDTWDPINIGQGIPDVYDQYRLVSASITLKYIGRLDIVSGVVGGAIVFDDNPSLAGRLSKGGGSSLMHPQGLGKYGNFDLAIDSFYHQENLTLEGIRELYFPLDNSYEEYLKTDISDKIEIKVGVTGNTGGLQCATTSLEPDSYRSGFNYLIYVLGAPYNGPSYFKVDIYCNFECLPKPEFLNYLPISMNAKGLASPEKANCIAKIQEKPIFKANGEDEDTKEDAMPNIWHKLKKKFKDGFPSFRKIMSKGLLNKIPLLKGGLSLAGSMVETQMNIDN